MEGLHREHFGLPTWPPGVAQPPAQRTTRLQRVTNKAGEGQPLLVMEAMKMEHTIAAPADGVVEALLYRVGDQVAEGAALVGFAASVPAPA